MIKTSHKFVRQMRRGARRPNCYTVNNIWDTVSFIAAKGIRKCFGADLREPGETVEVEITVKVLRKLGTFVPGEHFQEREKKDA